MTEASRIADLIQGQVPRAKRGTLRFWGDWFGRPFDNIHTIKGVSLEDDSIELVFDGGETLRISQPRNAVISDSTFLIRDASAVRWEWNKYGSPPGKRFFREYVRRGDVIDATTDVDWYSADLRPSADAHAVELV